MKTASQRFWPKGLAIVLIGALIGLLIGILADRAGAIPAPLSSDSDPVHTAREGRHDFLHDKLGATRARIHYPAKAKRIILDKLMHAQAQRRTAPGGGGGLTRAEMWHKFTSHDNCFFSVSSTSPNTATWTCQPGHYQKWVDDADWNRRDVHALICGTVTGVGIGGALARGASASVTGPAAPWIWGGIGVGWAACEWGPILENMAGD